MTETCLNLEEALVHAGPKAQKLSAGSLMRLNLPPAGLTYILETVTCPPFSGPV